MKVEITKIDNQILAEVSVKSRFALGGKKKEVDINAVRDYLLDKGYNVDSGVGKNIRNWVNPTETFTFNLINKKKKDAPIKSTKTTNTVEKTVNSSDVVKVATKRTKRR
tara:strand:+ start:120 stop:446 length:327 start_codon:yes stop_codon:yes gene_type:complete